MVLFDLKLEIEKIVKKSQEGADNKEIQKEVLSVVQKQEAISKQLSTINAIILIFDLYSGDYKALKKDLPKYLFFKDAVTVNKNDSSNLGVMIRISRVLDRMLDGDYTSVYKEIEARETEAELSEADIDF